MKAVIVKAENLLSDVATPVADLKSLVKELKDNLEFGLACRALHRMEEKYFPASYVKALPADRDPKQQGELQRQAVWVQQELALCTCKDEDVHATIRLPAALQILDGIGLRDTTQDLVKLQ
jgi:hypothetical protein